MKKIFAWTLFCIALTSLNLANSAYAQARTEGCGGNGDPAKPIKDPLNAGQLWEAIEQCKYIIRGLTNLNKVQMDFVHNVTEPALNKSRIEAGQLRQACGKACNKIPVAN